MSSRRAFQGYPPPVWLDGKRKRPGLDEKLFMLFYVCNHRLKQCDILFATSQNLIASRAKYAAPFAGNVVVIHVKAALRSLHRLFLILADSAGS
jgi:hypothetical protein